MGTKFEVIDENTVTVPEEGSHYILMERRRELINRFNLNKGDTDA